MAVSLDGTVQRGHLYAIVDEVDSILIDEARTPLIISGEPEVAAQVYYDFARVVEGDDGDAVQGAVEDRRASEEPDVDYTSRREVQDRLAAPARDREGRARAQDRQPVRPAQRPARQPPRTRRSRREALYHRDVDYVIQDGEVKIVDEFTGRIMEGRRWSEGLHQAVEAKEGVKIQEEHVTLATITLQNYFRLYEKLAGMTGTAKTEEKEFVEIYNLHVVEIPTNVPVARADENDLIFKTKEAKFDGRRRATSRSGTRTGSRSSSARSPSRRRSTCPRCSSAHGIPHNVLNAKEHAREAEIIMDAGQRGAVTIATNMAGRGVDIKLGEGVRELRRPLRARHRAPRGAPDRQPAPRPLGPPGRPRRDALLPLRPGRARPPVRGRPDLQDHGALQDPRGRADGVRDPLAARSRTRRRRSRSRTSSCARTSSSTTTS